MIHKESMTRRRFLKATMLGLGGVAVGLPWQRVFAQGGDTPHFNFVTDPENPTELEEQHLIKVRLPLIAEDGSNVPVVISVDNHPMEPDHYIKSIHMFNFNDPIVSKGLYNLTPANGLAYLSTQLRMDGGDAVLFVVCECSQHGKWVEKGSLKVSLGGC